MSMDIATQPDRPPDEPGGSPAADPSEEMAEADVANGEQPERPEQPGSKERSAYERDRTDHEPAGGTGDDSSTK
jgi:hypothetical protein